MARNAVVIASDAAQFPAAIFLAQRLIALKPALDTEIILFSDSLPMLEQAARWGRVRCRLRHVSSTMQFGGHTHVSGASLYRYFLPRLSEATHRVLYIDVDAYPENADIWRLLSLDMQGLPIAAVRDIEYAFGNEEIYKRELADTGRESGRYFNAGVLLIDVRRYAAADLERRLVSRSRMIGGWHDQKALNVEVQNQWLELSPACNMTPLAALSGLATRFPPVITHFKGIAKSWHGPMFPFSHQSRNEIERFIAASPWPLFVNEQAGKRGWRPGMTVLPAPAPQLPADFLARVAAYAEQTVFADRPLPSD